MSNASVGRSATEFDMFVIQSYMNRNVSVRVEKRKPSTYVAKCKWTNVRSLNSYHNSEGVTRESPVEHGEETSIRDIFARSHGSRLVTVWARTRRMSANDSVYNKSEPACRLAPRFSAYTKCTNATTII